MGLDVAIQTRKADFLQKIMEVTGGKGVDLVVNNVGGSMFAECVRALGFEGRLATVGYVDGVMKAEMDIDRKSTRLNSSHSQISYAVFCLKKKKKKKNNIKII